MNKHTTVPTPALTSFKKTDIACNNLLFPSCMSKAFSKPFLQIIKIYVHFKFVLDIKSFINYI